MAKFDPEHATVPDTNFSDRNSVERFLESGKFRPCANLLLPLIHQPSFPVNVCIPVCAKSRFNKTGVAQHLLVPDPGSRIVSPEVYTTVAKWAPHISCPRKCKGYRSKRWTALADALRRMFQGRQSEQPETAQGNAPDNPTRKWNRGEKIAGWTLVISALALIAAFLVVPEVRRFLRLEREPSSVSTTTTPVAPNNKVIAVGPKTKSEAPREKTVQPLKNPLEVVALDSSASLTIANNGPLSVYVVSLVLKSEEGSSSSYDLGFDIEPGNIYKHSMPHPGASGKNFQEIRPLAKLADTWNEHFRKATGMFQKCGMTLIYFSPSDPGFLQIKDAYSWKPERPDLNRLGLGYGDASGTLYYRVKGFTETKEQSVPLVVIVVIDGDKCPHSFLVPYTPTQSHP